MYSNKVRGVWDQVKGISCELWGEVTGDEQLFSEGLRVRMVGRLESHCDIRREDAEKQIAQLKQ